MFFMILILIFRSKYIKEEGIYIFGGRNENG